MKKQELFGLQQALNGVRDIKNTKFAYVVLKNLMMIEKEIKAAQELQQPSEDMKKFEQARIKLCTDMCKKDEQGTPIVKDNNFVIEEMEVFTKAMEELKVEYKEMFDAQGESQKQMIELMQEDCEIKFHKIKKDDLPEDLDAKQLEALDCIIV